MRKDQNQAAKEDVAILHELSPGVANSSVLINNCIHRSISNYLFLMIDFLDEQGVFLGNRRCSSCNSEKVYYIPDSAANQSDALLVSCSVFFFV